MKLSILFHFAVFVSICSTFADDKTSNSSEQLLSNETISSNNTDASDGKLTIEEQFDEDNSTLNSNETDSSSTKKPSFSSSSVGPDIKTTTPKSGKPRSPSFTVWSFFIGIFVAFLLIGLVAFLLKFFCQRRNTGNNVPYTAYQ